MAMNKETKEKMRKLRQDMKRTFADKHQRMINELLLERLSGEDIAHEIGATRMSVASWASGKTPNKIHAEAVARVYRQVMFLKNRGIIYADIMKQKTLDQAYSEAKQEEKAA